MFFIPVDAEIELGLLEERHAQAVFDLTNRNRDHLREWLPWVDSTKSVADTLDFIRRSLKEFSENNGFQVGIYYRGELAGCIGFMGFDWATGATEIGYWLGQEFTGKGIMARVNRKLVEYGFEELGLKRIEIRVNPRNLKSRAVPERLGFTQEAVLHKAGLIKDEKIDDLIVYALLREEWETNPGSKSSEV